MKIAIAVAALSLICAPAFAQDMSSNIARVASDAAALQQSQDADAQAGTGQSISTMLDQDQLNEDKSWAQIDATQNAYLGD